MYYNFSFCSDVSSYKKELDALDRIIGYNKMFVPNAKTLPLTFCLAKGRHLTASFEDLKLYTMFMAYETEMKRYFENILSFNPINKEFISFALKNTKQKDPWFEACLSFIVSFYSQAPNSSDGPFPEAFDRDALDKHIKKLKSVIKTRLTFVFDETTEHSDCIVVHEFPENILNLREGSIIIDNKYHKGLDLLFEDKLKIYGV